MQPKKIERSNHTKSVILIAVEIKSNPWPMLNIKTKRYSNNVSDIVIYIFFM